MIAEGTHPDAPVIAPTCGMQLRSMAIHGLALLVTHFNASVRAVQPASASSPSSLTQDQASRPVPVRIDPPVLLGMGGARSER